MNNRVQYKANNESNTAILQRQAPFFVLMDANEEPENAQRHGGNVNV